MLGNQIEEGNIEIAKFVGALIVEREGKLKGLWYLERTFPNGNHYARPDQFSYHSDWSWLMPVVEKIESLAGQETGHNTVEISNYHCRIYRYDYKEAFKSNDGRLNKIQATWNIIVQFIQWYNQNTK